MVLDVHGVVTNQDDAERAFMRHLKPAEKLIMQGFPKESRLFLNNDVLATKGAGNAYPVQLMCAVLAPLLATLESIDLKSWPSQECLKASAQAEVDMVCNAICKQPPKVMSKRRDQARKLKMETRKRKRLSASDSE